MFLRTRGKTRLILRSQVFEFQIVLDQMRMIQNNLGYNSLTRKLFEIRLTIQLDLTNDLDLIQIRRKNKYKRLMEKQTQTVLQNIPNPTLAKSAYKQTLT